LRQVAELERSKKDPTEPLAQAETCAHRLAALSSGGQERFQLARVLLAKKKDDEARAIINRLASEGPSGFGQAHLWMAGRLLSSDPLTRDQLNSAIGHLERATNWKRGDGVAAEAHRVLAGIYRSQNEIA